MTSSKKNILFLSLSVDWAWSSLESLLRLQSSISGARCSQRLDYHGGINSLKWLPAKKVDATKLVPVHSGLSTRLLEGPNDLVSGYPGSGDPKDQGEMFNIFGDLTLEVIYLPPYSIGDSPQTAPNARGRIN